MFIGRGGGAWDFFFIRVLQKRTTPKCQIAVNLNLVECLVAVCEAKSYSRVVGFQDNKEFECLMAVS
jgi:hypothetical protein